MTHVSNTDTHGAVLIDLSVAIIAIIDDVVSCCVVTDEQNLSKRLPFGPFFPLIHRTMENGLRQWVDAQVGVSLGHVEQLYTFGDRGRAHDDEHVVSVGYLALTEETNISGDWRPLYDFFPWENWYMHRPACLDAVILPALDEWAVNTHQRNRMCIAFGCNEVVWDEEYVLDRYELLYEAGLVPEAKTDGRANTNLPNIEGVPLQFDHRRILATALGRLRGKMKYRPVIFDLMPPRFTLTQLQKAAESVLGIGLHKQNFRRLVEKNQFVERTGNRTHARGRPAELYRFHHETQATRPLAGLRLKPHR